MNEPKNLTNVVKLGKLAQKQNCSHYFVYLINYIVSLLYMYKLDTVQCTIETREVGHIGYNASPFPIFYSDEGLRTSDFT